MRNACGLSWAANGLLGSRLAAYTLGRDLQLTLVLLPTTIVGLRS